MRKAWRRRERVAPFGSDLAGALGLALDHGDHGQSVETPLAGEASMGDQPVDIVADGMATHFDTAMITIGGLVALKAGRFGVGEEVLDFG